MRHLIFAFCLAAAGCAGQQVPVEGQPATEETSPLAVVAQGACIAGIVAAGVVLLNPGAIGGIGLCQ